MNISIVDVISIISGVRCTAMIKNEQIESFFPRKSSRSHYRVSTALNDVQEHPQQVSFPIQKNWYNMNWAKKNCSKMSVKKMGLPISSVVICVMNSKLNIIEN